MKKHIIPFWATRKHVLPFLALVLAMICFPLLLGSNITLATDIGVDTGYTMVGESNFDLLAFLNTALDLFFNVVIIIGLIMIVYAGFQYITAAGDTGKVSKALNTLIYALIGVAVAFLAKALVHWVLSTIE